jgi:hypothetical protein
MTDVSAICPCRQRPKRPTPRTGTGADWTLQPWEPGRMAAHRQERRLVGRPGSARGGSGNLTALP